MDEVKNMYTDELEAVYTIVLRNLKPDNYDKLLPEAQEVILKEAEVLLSLEQLANYKKSVLFDYLQANKIKNNMTFY